MTGKILNEGPKLLEDKIALVDYNFAPEEVKKGYFLYTWWQGLMSIIVFFFTTAWDIIGADVCTVDLDFFKTEEILKELNVTCVTLIPKVDIPSTVGDFSLISCYVVIYKASVWEA